MYNIIRMYVPPILTCRFHWSNPTEVWSQRLLLEPQRCKYYAPVCGNLINLVIYYMCNILYRENHGVSTKVSWSFVVAMLTVLSILLTIWLEVETPLFLLQNSYAPWICLSLLYPWTWYGVCNTRTEVSLGVKFTPIKCMINIQLICSLSKSLTVTDSVYILVYTGSGDDLDDGDRRDYGK